MKTADFFVDALSDLPRRFQFIIALGFVILCIPSVQANVLELSGEAVQGNLLIGTTSPGSKIVHDGKKVRVSRTGNFVIGFHRDNKPLSILEVTTADGRKTTRKLTVRQRDYKVQRINGLPPSKVTPLGEQVLKRIRRETKMVKAARKLDDTRLDFLEGFDWPVSGRISGVYGSQRILNGKPRRPHYGIDIAAPRGTPVLAPADGLVTLVHPDMYFSGGTMIVDHGHGVSSAFLHLQSITVKKGQHVKRGQKIATVGSTGRSTGAHLDWRINLFDKRLDPQLFARPMAQAGKTMAKEN